MSSAEAATNTVSTATGDANRGSRSYSVSGLDNDARFVLELHAISVDVVNLLIDRVGLTRRELAGMHRDAAIARLNEYWSTGR